MSRAYTFASVLVMLFLAVVSGCVSPEASSGSSQPVATTPAFAPSPTRQPEFPTPTQFVEPTRVDPTSQSVGIRQITDNTLSLRECWRKPHMCHLSAIAGRVACLLPDETRRSCNLRVYDAVSGNLMWEIAPAILLGCGDLAADSERVYTLDTYTVRAYDLNSGQELWDKWTFPDKVLALYSDGDKLYASMSIGDARFCTLEAHTGDTLGCGSLLADDGFQWIAQYPQFELYIRQSQYPSTDTMKLRAVDRITQQVLWSIDTGWLVGGSLMLVDDVLLIDARRLLAIDAQSGQILWRSGDFAWGTDGLASNAVVMEHALYAMDYNGRLFQLDPRSGREIGHIQFTHTPLPDDYLGMFSMVTDGQMLFISFGDTEELIALGP